MFRQGGISVQTSLYLLLALAVLPWPGATALADAGFSVPVPLNTNALSDAQRDILVEMATDELGHWVAVWRYTSEAGDNDVAIARSTDDGTTWTAPQALNPNAAADTANDSQPNISTDGAGHWIAVWESDDTLGGTIGADADVLVVRSTDNGATWTASQPLNANAASDAGSDWEPQIATDRAGHWVAVWGSNDTLGGTTGTDADILVAGSTDNGATWTAPQALNTNAGSDTGADTRAHLATDSAGHWVAVWVSQNLPGSMGDSDIAVARSSDNGATWTAPQALNANAASDGLNGDAAPQVRTDGAGHWVALWSRNDSWDGVHYTDVDIRAARSADNGATWTAPQDINPGTDLGYDAWPDFAVDNAGNWVAVWQVDMVGILTARSTDNGATWSAPQVLSGYGIDDSIAHVATDRAGHWIAAWDMVDYPLLAYGNDSDILAATMDRVTDTDGDGIADASETGTGTFVDDWDTGTDPGNTDSDADTLPDGWETDNGLDPNDDGSTNPANGAAGDPDSDSYSNADEQAAGTDPQDPASHPGGPALPLGGPVALALTALAVAAPAYRRLRPRRGL